MFWFYGACVFFISVHDIVLVLLFSGERIDYLEKVFGVVVVVD